MRLKFNQIHAHWLNDNFYSYPTTKELAVAFNKQFNANSDRQFIGKKCKHLGLTRANCVPYTAEEDAWLHTYANSVPYSQLSDMFEDTFGRIVTGSALSQHCRAIGVFSDNPNEFNNNIAWNKMDLYTERIGSRGERLIKTETGWIRKARYIYEKAYGKIPERHQIIQLDSNPDNFELDNLYCIPTKFMLMMNRNHWLTANRDLTLTAIKLCELHYSLQRE